MLFWHGHSPKKVQKILVHDDSYLSQVYVPSFMNPPSVSEFSERNYGKQHFICSASPPDISIVKVGGKFNSFLEQQKKLNSYAMQSLAKWFVFEKSIIA